MALDIRELFDGPVTVTKVKAVDPDLIQTKIFAAGTGTLVAGRAVGIVTASDKWAAWNNGNSPAGTNVVKGIVWPKAVTLDASDDVHGEVMIRGRMSINDVELGAETLANFKTAIKTAARGIGLDFFDYEYTS